MNFEHSKNEVAESPEKLIERSGNFEDLYRVLERVCPIRGTQAMYFAEQLINIIDRVRRGELTIDYVTRTHGLREKVASLLHKVTPEPPPPREAMVALEIPKNGNEESAVAVDVDSVQPPDPESDSASVTLEIKKGLFESEVVEQQNIPLSPLTDEEEAFYARAKSEYDQRFTTEYRLNLQSVPHLYLNIADPEVLRRFQEIDIKVQQIKDIENASSFESLYNLLRTFSFENSGETISGKELIYQIEQFRNGNAELSQLPEMLHHGIIKLVAKEIEGRLQKEENIEIKDFEWRCFMQLFPQDKNFLGNRVWVGYPNIGSENVTVREDGADVIVEGRLVWGDEHMLVFQNQNNFKTISTEKVVMENGKTFAENATIIHRGSVQHVRHLQRKIPKN